jgi:ferric-dicitrate binding protein FerR (iron transport regulator)
MPRHDSCLDSDHVWILLDRVAAGDATPDERVTLVRWAGDDPQRTALLTAVQGPTGRTTLSTMTAPADVERLWIAAQQRVGQLNTRQKASTPNGAMARRKNFRARLGTHAPHVKAYTAPHGLRGVVTRYAMGASAFVAAFIGIMTLRTDVPLRGKTATRTYTTAPGQQLVVSLPDGSRAHLAPQSNLRVASDFGQTTRTITLVGEALFTVSSAKAEPFIVRAGTVTTRVLGTTFGVRRYPHDSTTQIVVTSGRVATQGRSAPTTLVAGTVARVSDSTVTTQRISDPNAYTAWTRGMLVFKDTPVPEALSAVERWLGYRFRLADTTLTTEYITAVFNTATPNETLTDLADLLDVTMSVRDHVITLRRRLPALRTTPRGPHNNRSRFTLPTEMGK